MQGEMPVWRSLMYVPVNVEKFVDRAHTRGADGYVLDLEDSVPVEQKAHARTLIEAAADKVGRDGADVLVRINRSWRLAVRDIEAAVCQRVRALAVPKVAGPGHIAAIAEILDEVEAEKGLARGHTRIVAMVETADALFHARAIAGADPRVIGMVLGSEDFALSAGMTSEPESLMSATQLVAFAARAAGIMPLGFVGSIAEFRDQDRFRAMIAQARRLGFEGSFCIHPLQVQVCNEEFAPGEAEAKEAAEMIEAYRVAQAEGRGSITFNGKMIDEPVVNRARALLDRHRRIAARQNATATGS
jgi:citrate lyase subunit beta/citryl-CoA lyase